MLLSTRKSSSLAEFIALQVEKKTGRKCVLMQFETNKETNIALKIDSFFLSVNAIDFLNLNDIFTVNFTLALHEATALESDNWLDFLKIGGGYSGQPGVQVAKLSGKTFADSVFYISEHSWQVSYSKSETMYDNEIKTIFWQLNGVDYVI